MRQTQLSCSIAMRTCSIFWLLFAVVVYRSEAQTDASDERTSPSEWKINLESKTHSLSITYNDRPMAIYVWKDDVILRPYFKDVKATSGVQVTRNHPPIPGKDATDHIPFHPGIWDGWGDVGGVDFWRNQGRVVHERFLRKPEGGKSASFSVLNRFEDPNEKTVCHQEADYQFLSDRAGHLILVDLKFRSDKELKLGVQDTMGLAVRVATPLAANRGGAILSSTGGRGEHGTRDKIAKWWDYYGTVDGKEIGVVVMAAPSNGDVTGTTRDYGVLVANPVPREITVQPGKTARFAFGVFIYHQKEPAKAVDRDAAYQRFVEVLKSNLRGAENE